MAGGSGSGSGIPALVTPAPVTPAFVTPNTVSPDSIKASSMKDRVQCARPKLLTY